MRSLLGRSGGGSGGGRGGGRGRIIGHSSFGGGGEVSGSGARASGASIVRRRAGSASLGRGWRSTWRRLGRLIRWCSIHMPKAIVIGEEGRSFGMGGYGHLSHGGRSSTQLRSHGFRAAAVVAARAALAIAPIARPIVGRTAAAATATTTMAW